jgi:hypothetical protein
MTDLLLNDGFGTLSQVTGPYPINPNYVEYRHGMSAVADEGIRQALWTGEYNYLTYDSFVCEPESPHTVTSISFALPPFEVIRCVQSPRRIEAFFLKGIDWMACVSMHPANLYIDCATHNAERGLEIVKRFKSRLENKKEIKDSVTFQVWSGEEYPSVESFIAEDVKWSNVVNNYPVKTRESLTKLVNLKRTRSSTDGKLVLFHGEPGTGKTTAIKTLLESWRTWDAKAVLILDPELMLTSPKYLMSAMNTQSINDDAIRVIIIEDADDICSKNGPRSSSMSRLLQMLDGLVGSTKPVIVVMTTNASPSELDSALTRKGRCIATIEFTSFSRDEATARLGPGIVAHGPMTLAEIYHQIGENSMISNQTTTTFGQYL